MPLGMADLVNAVKGRQPPSQQPPVYNTPRVNWGQTNTPNGPNAPPFQPYGKMGGGVFPDRPQQAPPDWGPTPGGIGEGTWQYLHSDPAYSDVLTRIKDEGNANFLGLPQGFNPYDIGPRDSGIQAMGFSNEGLGPAGYGAAQGAGTWGDIPAYGLSSALQSNTNYGPSRYAPASPSGNMNAVNPATGRQIASTGTAVPLPSLDFTTAPAPSIGQVPGQIDPSRSSFQNSTGWGLAKMAMPFGIGSLLSLGEAAAPGLRDMASGFQTNTMHPSSASFFSRAFNAPSYLGAAIGSSPAVTQNPAYAASWGKAPR